MRKRIHHSYRASDTLLPDSLIPNTLAITYCMAGYLLGLVLLSQSWLLFPVGILLLAHSLVLAAYLLHECIHGALFSSTRPGQPEPKDRLGLIFSWMTGACFSDFARIRDKHMRHHFERADIVAVDYRQLLKRHPMLKRAVELGQKCCLPAVELLMHAMVLIRPFARDGRLKERRRVIVVGLVRVLVFLLLALIGGWPILLGYAVAYLLFLAVLGFMDAFQHEYLLLVGLDKSRGQSPTRDTARFPRGYFSREYEDSHTYSNLISERFPWLNLLVLNFCYHNIHHQKPMEPWHRLPSLHQQAVTDHADNFQLAPFGMQWRDFFRYRVERVMAPATDSPEGSPNYGAAGVSFLTAL